MPFFVKSLSLFLVVAAGGVLSSYTPISQEKGQLVYKKIKQGPQRNTEPVPTPIPLEPTYKSLKNHLFKDYCISCHHSKQNRRSDLTSKEVVVDHVQDILYYFEDGCDFGDCMPPENSGKPVPTQDVVEAFQKWVELDFPD